jgi:hypothetical protein
LKKQSPSRPIKIEALTSADFEVAPVREPKILIYDLETAPLVGFSWTKFDATIIEFIHESYILTWSAKWLGGKHVTKGLPDYPNYEVDPRDDRALVKELYDMVEQADIIVAHNGDKFDVKRMNARFLIHGFQPTHKYITRDTLKMVKAKFNFPTHGLNDLGERLGFGKKIKTDFSLWKGCLAGDMAAWRKMKRYNRRDVELLEQVYLLLRPWDASHPNLNVYAGRESGCGKCGHPTLQSRGFHYTKTGRRPEYRCGKCGASMSGPHQAIAITR